MEGELKIQKRGTPNFDLFTLFIEVGMLNEIRYKLGCVPISKISKNVRFILIKGFPGRASTLGQSALAMCRSALQECRMALLSAESAFEFWSNLDSLFEDF